jgi:hypothetical protein
MTNPFKLLATFCTVSAVAGLALFTGCGSPDTTTPAEDSVVAQENTGDGFVSMFDGKTLQGWDGDTAYWRAENGELIGEVTAAKPLKNNTFLIWKGGEPGDFEFKAEFKIDTMGNSGVQYRSEELKDIRYALKGYQADIDGKNVYTGQNYEERGRGFLAMRGQIAELPANGKPVITGSLGSSDSLKGLIKNDWNEIHIIARGNNFKHYINGVLMSEATDNDEANRKAKGLIGLQVHVMPSMKVEYRNLQIKQ